MGSNKTLSFYILKGVLVMENVYITHIRYGTAIDGYVAHSSSADFSSYMDDTKKICTRNGYHMEQCVRKTRADEPGIIHYSIRYVRKEV